MLAELQRLNETWNRAWLQKDAATVERLMAEDYLYVGPKGPVLDGPAILGIIRSPSYRLDRSTRTDCPKSSAVLGVPRWGVANNLGLGMAGTERSDWEIPKT